MRPKPGLGCAEANWTENNTTAVKANREHKKIIRVMAGGRVKVRK
jgi:hypothetical protein